MGGRGRLKLFELLVEAKLAPSKSEARRLVKQGAVRIDRERVMDPMEALEVGEVLVQVGKRRFARVKIEP
jgi:tyrosyl-tRNA synthetase